MALAYPAIDPIAIEIGPVAIRWYALAYIAGIVGGWKYAATLNDTRLRAMSREALDDFVVWVTMGIILGGRLGYVLFYKPSYYLAEPLEALMLWRGGMSFHGGMLGVIIAIVAFARRNSLDLFRVGDLVTCVVPIGLFFGRVANFINGELFGRVAPDVPWAMIFPHGGPLPRHPSQIYQASLEGLALFAVLFVLSRRPQVCARRGMLAGIFLAGYGVARCTGEIFREPDAFLGFLWGPLTMGMLLSLPMIAAGIWLVVSSKART
ncbi:MAG: prolipoprotein diacylglyceryl transferase [Alphaproteobacteria bacterium]|nr:prolipoprotein diacylglyceryl transferase [Alphaproteobacteria bacterium]